MEGVEPSVLVRYVVQDDPLLGAAAARLLDGEVPIAVGLVALAETAFVLTRHYGVPRAEAVDRLVQLVNKRTLRVLGADKALVISALLGCRESGRISFADALIQVEAQSHSLESIVTFDRRLPLATSSQQAPTVPPGATVQLRFDRAPLAGSIRVLRWDDQAQRSGSTPVPLGCNGTFALPARLGVYGFRVAVATPI